MCLAQGPQHSEADEARTHGPSVSSKALYHWAPLYCLKILIGCWIGRKWMTEQITRIWLYTPADLVLVVARQQVFSYKILTLCPLWNFPAFLLSADFFQYQPFQKILSRILSEYQTVWTQIRPDILSGLIWVQTVCKSYQQTTLGVNRTRGNKTEAIIFIFKWFFVFDVIQQTRPNSALDLRCPCTSSMCEQSLCKVWI